MLFHYRNATKGDASVDFFSNFSLKIYILYNLDVIRENRRRFSSGVVHGFMGSKMELDELIAL